MNHLLGRILGRCGLTLGGEFMESRACREVNQPRRAEHPILNDGFFAALLHQVDNLLHQFLNFADGIPHRQSLQQDLEKLFERLLDSG